jgi:16S rRNA (guanine527-N7)-methyltransferase
MSKEEFIKELTKINIKLTQTQLEQLQIYCEFLIEYNSHTNLTAIKTPEEVYLKHFYDSLSLIKAIDLSKVNNLLDIGTGAGFPGMVLKIVYPHLDVTLLDSNNKKITFLKELANKLNIKVELIQQRAEEYILHHRQYYDVVVSRAVAPLNILCEISIPFVKLNGFLIAMKGHAEDELNISSNSIKECGGKLIKTEKFLLPVENSERTLIVISKEVNTPNKYPRQYDKIIKKPL